MAGPPSLWVLAWSEEDGEFVATTPAYPSLSWLAPTPIEALAGLVELVEQGDAVAAADARGIPAAGLVRARYERSFLIRRTQVWGEVLVPGAMMAAVEAGTAGPDVDQYICDQGVPTSETDEAIDDDRLTWTLTRTPAGR
jgi:hypothetical protein